MTDPPRHEPLPAVRTSSAAGRLRLGALIIVVLAAIAILLGAPGAGRSSTRSFGPFAGYVWRGAVTSVSASWAVPAIASHSPPGVAATWIGAQAPGPRVGFIQIGTSEQISRKARSCRYTCFAFWSDRIRSFHPKPLFTVKAGDRISASLRLSGKHWKLQIRDVSSGSAARFSTNDETDGSFNEAQWIQEDPTNAATKKLFPYPRLSATHFRALTVNSQTPAYDDLYSQWMSTKTGDLAPSELKGAAFTLRVATVNRNGARYLKIAKFDDSATERFDSELASWRTDSRPAHITAARSRFAAALQANARALQSERWPAPVRGLIERLVAVNRTASGHIQTATPASAAGLARWIATWRGDGARIGETAHKLRRALAIPELTP